ncbi:MAG: hypothetical protein Q7R52_00305 [archaeon]|nr:hypothetical protein [archaeon]
MEKEEKIKEVEEVPKKEENTDHNKLLVYILLFGGIIIITSVLVFYFLNSSSSFKYRDVQYSVEKVGDITFYRTVFPMYNMMTGQHIADYNARIRNDPRELRKIPFTGEFKFRSIVVINSESNFTCDTNGDRVIAVAEILQFFEITKAKVIKDENATCDSEGRYMYINLVNSSKTEVVQTGPVCYELRVNNCEILKSSERFMVEGFSTLNRMLNSTA